MITPFTSTSAATAVLASVGPDLKVVARKATIREGVYAGLTGLLPPGASLEGRLSIEGRMSFGGSSGLADRLNSVVSHPLGHSASPQRSSSGGPMTPHVEHKIETLVAAPAAVEEALASLIVDHQDPALQYRALLTYIKRIYHPFLLREPQVSITSGKVVAAWIYDDPRLANTMHARHKGGAFLVIPSLEAMADALPAVASAMAALGTDCAGGMLHVAVCGSDAVKLSQGAEQLLASGGLGAAEPDTKVFSSAELIAHEAPTANGNGVAGAAGAGGLARGMGMGPQEKTRRVAAAVADAKAALRRLQVACVSVLAPGMGTMPLRSGFVWEQDVDSFKYDPFLRQVEGPVARLLELDKLSSQQVLYMPSRNRQWHMYACSDREPRGPALKRLFLRGQVRQLGHPALLAAQYSNNTPAVAAAAVNELEEALVNCLEELMRPAPDHGAAGKADWVHLYFSVLPLLPLHHQKEEGRVASALRSAVAALVAKHTTAFRQAGVAVWEIRFRVPDISGAWRVLVSCPTGHEAGEEHVEVYREALPESGTGAGPKPTDNGHAPAAVPPAQRMCYVVPLCEQQSGVPPSDCSLHGRRLLAPYPSLEPLQLKRLAARRHNTTYCYDFPTVFENALRDIWAQRAAQGEPNSVPPAGRLVEAVELKLPANLDQTFRSVQTKLERVEREPGLNTTGMVAWMMTLKTPECPQGRQVVAIANDITFQSGAFGPREDCLFKAATELALEERLPCIYLAANSGARLGVANEIRDNLRVAWVDDDDPSKGFSYIYLSDADYHKQLPGGAVMGSSVRAEPLVTPTGEKRWVVSDIIGAEDGLGVENLSGSGAIASTYCRAWREGFTITLVSGRTVGIGAYLARLGRRCVQRSDQPIILTGYAALNKVLGRQVYTSHMQLGGPRVMGVNGVSHHVVQDDLEGVKAILRWLSFAPPQIGAEPPRLASGDGVDRPVTYCPAAHEKLDPRAAIAGRDGGPEAGWESGLFDRGSWVEAQAGWARSVVTGRARLGGVPVGVIAVETQTQMRHIPADPGDPASSEVDIPQAGQVWWPDSADKTAQAIEEFDREGLPLFILANWRGFAGGMRDLFEGVLQAGSLIVEQLRVYHQPVFVYIPGGGELRGGAWVVVDAQINPTHIEMYADPGARGGVLEPEGLVEIKFRTPDLIKAMHRLDPEIARLKAEGGPRAEGAIKAREKALLPTYQQVARQFADMHDTPSRMYAKGTLRGVVPWREARRFFSTRLQRRLVEEALVRHVASTDVSISRHAAIAMVAAWHATSGALSHLSGSEASLQPAGASALWGEASLSPPASAGGAAAVAAQADLRSMAAAQVEQDRAFLAWAESPAGRAQIALELKVLRSQAASRLVTDMLATAEGKEGLLRGLQAALGTDTALATQLRSLLQRPSG